METPETTGTGDAAGAQQPTGAPAGEGPGNSSAEVAQASPAPDPVTDEQIQRQQAKLDAAIAQRRRDFEQERAETPVQVVKIRPDAKQQLLGLLVVDDRTREVLRAVRMVDWRTEQISLQAGQSAHIVVLVGDELAHFEGCEQLLIDQRGKRPADPVRESVAQDRLEG